MRLCQAYLDYSKTKHVTKTYKYKAATIRNLLHFLGHSEWPSSLDILRYLESRARTTSGNAFNADRKDLHAMFEWGKKYGLASTNLVSQIDKMGYTRKIRYIPSMDDINLVLLVAGEYRDLLECCLYTLGRKSEILKLRWEDIDFERNKIRLWTRKRKDGSEEYDELPMPKPLRGLLFRLKKVRGGSISTSWVFPSPYAGTARGSVSGRFSQLSSLMRRLCGKAGVKPFGFHAFRHYGASYLIRRGADLKTVQLWLRHRNLETTQRYVHEMPDSVKAGAEILGEMGREDVNVRASCGPTAGKGD